MGLEIRKSLGCWMKAEKKMGAERKFCVVKNTVCR